MFKSICLFLAFAGGFSAAGAQGQASRVFARLRPLVFQIKTAISATAPKNSYGTGFVVDKSGLLITNYHVVADSILEPERYHVYLVDGGASFPAEVVRVNVIDDLALVRVQRTFPGRIEISAAVPAQGSAIYSLGIPEDLNMSIVEGTFNGVIMEGPYSKIHMSSPINAGMSGGPTVDGAGRLLGVNVSRLLFSNNVSFAVPKKGVSEIIDSWAKVKSGTPPPTPLEFEDEISNQLRAAGQKIYQDLVQGGREQRRFGPWRLPALPEEIRCWSDKSPVEKEKKYSVVTESCFLMNSAHLGHGVGSAEFAMEARECVRSGLNGLQFFNLLNDHYAMSTKTGLLGSPISRDTISEFTAPICTSHKIVNAQGVPLLVHACTKEFVRYGGVFESAVDLVSLLSGRRNLVLKVGFSGLTFERSQEMIKYFIDAVGFHAED
jgi:hypothetical protein